jgi:hypothetical protein
MQLGDELTVTGNVHAEVVLAVKLAVMFTPPVGIVKVTGLLVLTLIAVSPPSC